MTPEIREFLRTYLSECGEWLDPLLDVADRPRALYGLLARMGWNLEALLASVPGDIRTALVSGQTLFEAVAGSADAADLNAAGTQAHTAFSAAEDDLEIVARKLLAGDLPTPATETLAALGQDLLQIALIMHLERRHPEILSVGRVLGVVRDDRATPIYRVDASHGAMIRLPVRRPTLEMGHVVAAVEETFARLLGTLLDPPSADGNEFLERVNQALEMELAQAHAGAGNLLKDGLSVKLDINGLVVESPALPHPQNTTAPTDIRFPFPLAPELRVEPGRWTLGWTAAGAAATGQSLELFEVDGLRLALTGGDTAGCPARGLTLQTTPDGYAVQISGGLELGLPLGAVSGSSGDRLTSLACATIKADVDNGATFTLDQAVFEGTVHLADSGLVLENAAVKVEDLTLPPAPGTVPSFAMALGGTLVFGQSRISVAADWDGANFGLTSTGEINFGNGIWLEPDGSAPVLTIKARTAGQVSFEVAGLFRLPHGQDSTGTRTVAVKGELELERAASGSWTVNVLDAGLSATNLQWELPGGIVLEDTRLQVGFDGAAGQFFATVGGKVSIGSGSLEAEVGLLFDDPGDPSNIRIDAALSASDLNFSDLASLVDLYLTLKVATRPLSGELAIVKASGGMFPLASFDPANPAVSDFQIGMKDLAGAVDFTTTGAGMEWSSGRLILPPTFSGASSGRATVSLTGSRPLSVRATTAGIEFRAELEFTDFGVAFGGAPTAFAATLDRAILKLDGITLPELSEVSGTLQLPMPGGNADVAFSDLEWNIESGLPTGSIRLAQDLPPQGLAGLELHVLGGGSTTHPVTAITISRTSSDTVFRIETMMRLVLSGELIRQDGGQDVWLESGGSLTLSVQDPMPRIQVTSLQVGGTFRLGGDQGLLLENASLAADNLDNLMAPTVTEPFIIRLSGDLVLMQGDGSRGPGGGLDNARFIFEGDPWPRFDLDGVVGATGDLDIAGGYIPMAITRLELAFDPARPMPQKLLPQHTIVTADATLGVADIVSGGVEGLTIALNDQGIPTVSVDGLLIDVSAFKVADGFSIGGAIGIGGLNDIPGSLVLAGKLGGKLNGAGVEALAAIGIVDGIPAPLGASLEASMGPAGIPLWASGFLLTGASGGVSFTGGNADPDDMRAYIQVADDDTVSSQPRPAPGEAADTPVHEQSDTAPASGPPAGQTLAFACPDEPCPPPTVGVLYEPHPDSERYPHRIIWKFSSLNRQQVDDILTSIGLSPASLQTMTPDAIGDQIATGIVQVFRNTLPFADSQLSLLEPPLAEFLGGAADVALAGGSSVYDALVAAAYKGVRAPNVSLKLTGTISYTGVSSFLSVTGGVVVCPTAQYAGVVGSLNLIGVPVGRLRAFIMMNNAAGNPDPSLCGNLTLALGPLELGYLKMKLKYGLDAVVFTDTVIGLVGQLGGGVSAAILDQVDHDLFESHGRDVAATMAAMEYEQILAFVALLQQQNWDAKLQAFMVDLFDATWQVFQPELLVCGSAQPKLCGMALDQELVGISAMAKKDPNGSAFLAASFRFSPSGLLSRVLYGILPPFDAMKLSFRVGLPDPRTLVASGITGEFSDPAKMAPRLDAGIDHMLQQGVATIDYEIAPMGLKLADAEGRLMMPDLTSHPASPSSTWKRPENRSPALPSRLDVALAALRENKLADVFWIGTTAELKALPTLANSSRLTSETLFADYFPHGGILGAGTLMLPRILVDAPPFDLLEKIATGSVMTRVQAAMELVNDHILKMDEIGRLAFYLPAPNPPAAALGANLSPQDLIDGMSKNPFDVATGLTGELYSLDQSFFQGSLGRDGQPVTILGIPLIQASVAMVPPAGTGTEGSLRITAKLPAGSWLHSFLRSAAVQLLISARPARPIEKHFQALAPLLSRPSRRNQAAQQVLNDLDQALPKVSLVATVNNFRIPSPWSRLMSVEAGASFTFGAYSPHYAAGRNPSRNETAMQRIERLGGAAISGKLRFGGGLGLSIRVPRAELAFIMPVNGFPGLKGEFQNVRVRLPFGIPLLNGLSMAVDLPSGGAQPTLTDGALTLKGKAGATRVDLLLDASPLRLAGSLNRTQQVSNLQLGPVTIPGTGIRLADSVRISAQLTIDGQLDIRKTGGSARFNVRFRWRNRSWSAPQLKVGAGRAPSLDQAIKAHLKAEAFDTFAWVFANPTRWLNALKAGWMTLNNRTSVRYAQIFSWMGLDSDDVAKELQKLGFSAKQIDQGLRTVFRMTAATAVAILEDLGYGAHEIMMVLKAAYRQGGESAAKLMAAVGFTADEIAGELKAVYGQTARQVARALKRAQFTADDVAGALDHAFSLTAKSAADALKWAGFTAKKVADALDDVLNASTKAVAKALRDAGYSLAKVALGLRSMTSNSDTAAKALKYAGYGVKSVAKGLKGTFTNSSKTAAKALRSAGFTSKQVCDGLYDQFSTSMRTVARALDYAGYGLNTIAQAIARTFNKGLAEVTSFVVSLLT